MSACVELRPVLTQHYAMSRVAKRGAALLPIPVIDNFHNSKPEAVHRIEELALRELPSDASEQDKADCRIELVMADLRNPRAVENVFKDRSEHDRIHSVILIGALKAVGESAEIPIDYYNVNAVSYTHL